MSLLKAFLVGGGICVIGQVLINLTHLTNGKILVIFLLLGCVLEGFGLYTPLIEFAGAGASVPISGFGCVLVNGAFDAAKNEGVVGLLSGGLAAAAGGVSVVILFGYIIALIFKPRTKTK
ncbi:MAG: SpoVA/SpoVAEb family sporulation membrane protein [Clostridia bacterium]|nr:SpoVA/SpoVAEb family sporulation membrane protein [Clostridia bacterium]